MKAICINPGKSNLFLADRQEPQILNADEIKLRTLLVGICGTDREEVSGGRADAPHGSNELVIGHEMLGEVVAVGASVKKLKPGDHAVFSVRRGCGKCAACLANRSDMCYTGLYKERGIKELDGYQCPYVVDKAQYAIKVPSGMGDVGVLTEPMSIAAKAIDEAMQIQATRLKDFDAPGGWMKGKKALVAGIGPVGLLAAFALRLLEADVIGLDIVEESSIRPRILESIGGKYIHGGNNGLAEVLSQVGAVDFIFEATGIASLQFDLIDMMAINGIYVATGIPSGARPVNLSAGLLMQHIVLKNLVVLGSVNASPAHYEQAVSYLLQSVHKWPGQIEKLITNKFDYSDFESALHHHTEDEIKVVVDWSTYNQH